MQLTMKVKLYCEQKGTVREEGSTGITVSKMYLFSEKFAVPTKVHYSKATSSESDLRTILLRIAN